MTSETPDSSIVSGFEIFWQFTLLYVYLFSYNILVLKGFLYRKQYAFFLFFTIIYILVLALVIHIFETKAEFRDSFFSLLVSSFTIIFFNTAIYLAYTGISNSFANTKLKLLHKEAEIKFLNQQLSPHFLYNAINNLYGIALSEPELIADKILELSDLLHYQVEATTKKHVNLLEEMAFIESYVNYVQYRSNGLKIINITEGVIQPWQILPLLFLPLIENAVKYAMETEKAFIHIVWQFKPNGVFFGIENSSLSHDSRLKGTNVGIENLKKRLDLSKVKYQFTMGELENHRYKTELMLWELPLDV